MAVPKTGSLCIDRAKYETPMTLHDVHEEGITPDGRQTEVTEALISGLEPVTVAAGSVLIRQGEHSDEAYFIANGVVRVEADTCYGAVPLSMITAPKLLGEIGAISGLPRIASIIAVSEVQAYPIPRSRLLEVGREAPGFLAALIGQLGKQLENVNRTLGIYSNALAALQSRDFDPRILDELSNPSPEFAEFSAAFRKFAKEIVGKRRGQDEVASAAIIQNSYLPNKDVLSGLADALDLHARMRPARNVSGDLYDFFPIDENRVFLAIGDVCGKGIPASLFMAVVMTVLRIAAREERNPESIILRANGVLGRDNAASMFATLFFGVLDLRNGTLEYCNCGHNPPLLVSGDGSIRQLAGTGLPLAIDPDGGATARSVTLAPDDLLVLFTDGVTEAMNAAHEEFSDGRLLESIGGSRSSDPEAVVHCIFDAVDRFVEDAEQSDDITCIALRCTPRAIADFPAS